jgi:hypothetical protein
MYRDHDSSGNVRPQSGVGCKKEESEMAEPVLDGQPHAPISDKAVHEAEQVYQVLKRGKKPDRG